VRIPDEPRIAASLVFDMETGVVLASAVAGDEEEVLQQRPVRWLSYGQRAGLHRPRRGETTTTSRRLKQQEGPFKLSFFWR
jgi:hypothetical protein